MLHPQRLRQLRREGCRRLPIYEAEGKPHLRIEECVCKVYVKSVDLRKDGFGVPVVDDLASVELASGARRRGSGSSRNLLGM